MKNQILLGKNLEQLNKFVSCHSFKKNQVIFYEGHIPYGLFILFEGEIEIIEKNWKRRVSPISIIEKNIFFEKQVYNSTAKSIADSKLYFLSTESYMKLKENNHFIIKMIEELK